MNQIERYFAMLDAERIIGNANRELLALRKTQSALEKVLLDKTVDAAVRAGTAYDMDVLVKRLDVVEDRRSQASRRIDELDHEAARQGEIRVISWSDSGVDSAQVVVHYTRDDGKKMSYTRHLHREGKNWVGLSTLTSNRVIYRLPGTGLVEKAA